MGPKNLSYISTKYTDKYSIINIEGSGIKYHYPYAKMNNISKLLHKTMLGIHELFTKYKNYDIQYQSMSIPKYISIPILNNKRLKASTNDSLQMSFFDSDLLLHDILNVLDILKFCIFNANLT